MPDIFMHFIFGRWLTHKANAPRPPAQAQAQAQAPHAPQPGHRT